MADELKARPVSGEIMTGPGQDAAGKLRVVPATNAADIIDADFETLPRLSTCPDTVLSSPVRSIPVRSISSPNGMDSLRKPKPEPQRAFAKRGGPMFWMSGISIACAAFWIAGGHTLAQKSPFFSAAQSPGSMLSISAVTSRVDVSGTRPVLFVDGEAGNDGIREATMPPVEIQVTGNDGSVTHYTLGTAGRALAPGERFGFSSRVEAPTNGVKTVSVAFAG